MTDVAGFYHDVINDVINGVKDELVEEGLDLQVLDELKKLWTTKLEQSRVFDSEPSVNTAAQYLNLVQRSQTQLRPAGPVGGSGVSIRPVAPAGRVVVSNMANAGPTRAMGVQGSLATIRPSTLTGPTAQPLATGGVYPQRLPQHTLLHSNLVAGAGPATTAQLQPRGLVPGSSAQLAALPSGLTGQLVQIGQQTYLVPQTIVGLRQPMGSSQLSLSHLVGTAGGQNLDPTAFQQTQVDGKHDNDDSPGGAQRSSNNAGRDPSSNRPETRASDFEEDDDDDDDDFVAATPGFNPASVRHHYPMHDSIAGDSTHHPDVPSLNSAPQTPMTPASVLSRTSFVDTPGWRRPLPARHVAGATPSDKKRRRRSSGAADTDTDYDDDDGEDAYGVGDDAELATNASMTPGGHGLDHEFDSEHVTARARLTKSSRGTTNQAIKPHSPTASQLGDAPPDTTEPGSALDNDALHGEEEHEEEQEDEEPLNSGDDVSDEEPEVLFESENVVVCQYDKIHRCRNRWRFHLKDGIMAIHGRDHVFQKAVGEAEW